MTDITQIVKIGRTLWNGNLTDSIVCNTGETGDIFGADVENWIYFTVIVAKGSETVLLAGFKI